MVPGVAPGVACAIDSSTRISIWNGEFLPICDLMRPAEYYGIVFAEFDLSGSISLLIMLLESMRLSNISDRLARRKKKRHLSVYANKC